MNFIKKKWSRRDFLRAAGISAGAASMLNYMPALALDGAQVPKRVVFFMTPLGSRILSGWRPMLEHGEVITPGSLRPILNPLADYADKMLLVEGLDMGPTYYGTSEVRMDSHNARSCLWTGANLYPVDACAGQGYIGFAEGHSLDREIHNAWGLDLSKLHTVAIGKPGCIESRAVSYYEAAGSPVLGEFSPANYFDTYWGPGLTVVGNAERAALARLKMYAQVGDRLKALRQQLPKRDHIRFDRHISAMDMLQAELSPGASNSCQAPEVPTFSDTVEKMQLGKPKNKDLVSQWFKLIAASIRCDAGRVFGVQYGYEGHTGHGHGITPSGITGNLHEMSHLANSDPVAAQLMTEFNAYFSKELKSFMDLLAGIPEADGTTALDNTLIVWGTALSDADQHSNRNIPFVLLGGGATDLNMGRYYNFGNWPASKSDKDHGGKPHNHLLVTILHALGIEADHFGTTDVPSGNLDCDLLSSVTEDCDSSPG